MAHEKYVMDTETMDKKDNKTQRAPGVISSVRPGTVRSNAVGVGRK